MLAERATETAPATVESRLSQRLATRSGDGAALTPERAGAVLTIDLDAIIANWRLLGRRASRATCAAVVKADAYGLGAALVAPALAAAGCRTFFVAHLDEALALRPHLPREATLAVLHGPPPGTEAEFADSGLLPVLNSIEQIRLWSEEARSAGHNLPAMLQIDTGMSRLGLSPDEIERVSGDPHALDGIDTRAVISHLACADAPEHPANPAQRAAFDRFRARLPAAPASLSASSGIFLGPEFHYDLVRPGAALYGLAPAAGPNPLRPVVRLQARIVQLRTIGAGTAVGYGHTWTARRPTRLATLAVGYADGLMRCLGGRPAAWLGDIRLPIVGRISMDSITVDATDLPEGALSPGDPLDLIGAHQSVDDLAQAAGTIGYEILTGLGPRFHRVYLEGK